MRIRLKKIKDRGKAEKYIESIGADDMVIDELSEKMTFSVILLENVPSHVANILKQVALTRGTDAAVHRNAITNEVEYSNVLLPGTTRELKLIAEKLKEQPFGLDRVGGRIKEIINYHHRDCNFKIMGVLNITPDSFFDGGEYIHEDEAVKRFEAIAEQGADIIDVGAESSRPGAKPLSREEELKRLEPVIGLFDDIEVQVSIDTYKSDIAEKALKAGATMVNDISACRMDEKMADIVKEYNSEIVLMHMQGTPETMQENPEYDDVIGEIYSFFEERIEYCLSKNIGEDKIILDPGIGFGKRHKDNLRIMNSLEEFKSLGFPVLVGTSRKSMIGNIINKPPPERLYGTLATVVHSFLNGADIFRVHDVNETLDALKVISEIEGIND